MKLWNIEKYHSVMDLRWHLSENQWTKLADCDREAFSGKTHSKKMTWYARSAGKNMGWLRHVLTLLSVVIFVSFDIFNVIIILMKLLFCNWTLYFSHMLSSVGHFTAIICFLWPSRFMGKWGSLTRNHHLFV